MPEHTFLDRVEQQLDHDNSTVIRCQNRRDALELTTELYKRFTSEHYHLEHYPVTDDETGMVSAIDVIIRQLHFERDLGWFSADVPPEYELMYDPKQTQLGATNE